MAAPFDLTTVETIKENYAPLKSGRVLTAPLGLSARAAAPAAPRQDEWAARIAASADPLAVWKECVCFSRLPLRCAPAPRGLPRCPLASPLPTELTLTPFPRPAPPRALTTLPPSPSAGTLRTRRRPTPAAGRSCCSCWSAPRAR
jgi:hypothetical protein